ncbi:MAG: HD domain-containing protein [Fibrobacterales bacterium]|nr:HD domain-containing protein [Fibrobacterales bacterium]
MTENARTASPTPSADVRQGAEPSRLLERARLVCQNHFFATGVVAWSAVFAVNRLAVLLMDRGRVGDFRREEWVFFLMLLPVCLAGAFLLSGGLKRQQLRARLRLESAQKRNDQFRKASTIGFARVTAARDASTALHLRRVGRMAETIARALSHNQKYRSYVTEQYIADLSIAAALHDVGRVGITDDILRKTGSLTASEFESMKMHVIVGGDLIAELQRSLPFRSYFELAREIAYHHHQRWDGTGYPNVLQNGNKTAFFVQSGVGAPLAGEKIPLSARIVAVADVYDALVSKRPYKDPIPHEEAVRTILAERGTHFDPDVVDAFDSVKEEMKRIVREIAN